MITETISISRRFCGPPQSGNGGYVCGRLAKYIDGPAAVRLKASPPLEVELRIEADGETARLLHGPTVIAEARRGEPGIETPAAPSYTEAERASESYRRFKLVFPGCFVCGPQRPKGDGLRIFPGTFGDGPVLAAPWVPDDSLAGSDGNVLPEFLWAALDCAGAFANWPPEDKAVLLGELCTRMHGVVSPGQSCVVVAWPIAIEGRKRLSGTAVLSPSGKTVALARATWIEVPRDGVASAQASSG